MRLLLLVAASIAEAVFAKDGLSHCCEALRKAGLGDSVIVSGVDSYKSGLSKYFSQSAILQPQCFFEPRCADDVATAVEALVKANKTEACQFAVRGGGHMHFAGAAGIESGVTIDLGKMDEVTYYKENNSVSVGAGAVWEQVYSALDKIGVMTTGARSSSVGVAGSTLGGGNSFYAARNGLICDNVLQFEVVLGDGSVVTASKDEKSDLFRALKGGSSNFGIVTRLDYQTFEGGDIFGGVVLYPANTSEQQLRAILNFGDAIKSDPYGSAIVISVYASQTKTPMFMNAYEYTKPVKRPDAPIFKEFLAIPGNLSDTTGLRNMSSLVHELEVPKDHRVHFSTLTFKSDMRIMRKAHEAFGNVTTKLAAEAKGDWELLTLYQPIPALFAKHGTEKGGNVLGLDRFNETLIMYEPCFKWQGAEQDELFESQAQWLRDEISGYARSIGGDNEWLYLNYADKVQNPLESYGPENMAIIDAVARKYDPKGVFQYMMPGGFKISKVENKAVATSGAEKAICWAETAAQWIFRLR